MSAVLSVTRALCDFVVASPVANLPDPVLRATRRAFCNWLGCALGAAQDESLVCVLQVAMALGGYPQASVVGRLEQLDVVNAALVNGVGANALDYDDMHVPSLIHPTGAVVAAALAIAEHRHANGTGLLRAVATGIEIECRLGGALFPAHYDAGWHSTATLGALGAAAAAASLLGLDATRSAHAFGIAATQASGLRAMLPNACKSYNVGHAAANGVRAALLAEAGLVSAPDVFEAAHGFFAVFGRPPDGDPLLAGLGEHYAVTEISLKPYPCGVVIHPLIDAALEVAREHDIDARRIRTVQARVHPRALELGGKKHPQDAIGGRFSLYHAAALALTRRAAGLAAFDAAAVRDKHLAALRDRMEIVADPGSMPGEARIMVEDLGGTRYDRAVHAPSGSPLRPLTDDQLRQKFLELARRAVTDECAQGLFGACAALENLHDVAELRRFWVT